MTRSLNVATTPREHKPKVSSETVPRCPGGPSLDVARDTTYQEGRTRKEETAASTPGTGTSNHSDYPADGGSARTREAAPSEHEVGGELPPGIRAVLDECPADYVWSAKDVARRLLQACGDEGNGAALALTRYVGQRPVVGHVKAQRQALAALPPTQQAVVVVTRRGERDDGVDALAHAAGARPATSRRAGDA